MILNIVTLICTIVLLALTVFYTRKVREENEALREHLSNMAVCVSQLESCCGENAAQLDALCRKLEALRQEFDDVIADDLKARAEGDRLFNEGLRGIMDYGGQIPTLNKEGLRHE